MNNIEKEVKIKMKVTDIFKVIIIAFLVITFTVSVISCKEKPPAVEEQQEEKGEVTIPSETKEETTETVPETTAEIEKVNAPEIAGLKFDQATKTYLAEANNTYGLEEDEVAGVYVKEAIEINGKMENAIGLIPEVIEPIQKKIYDKEKEYLCPIMFNLKKIVGDVKIKEMDVETEIGKGYYFLGINLPPNTNFYIPASGNWMFLTEDNQFWTNSLIFKYDIDVENDLGRIDMSFKEVNIIKDMEKIGVDMLKLGEVFGEIVGNSYLEEFNNEVDYIKFKEPGIYQFSLVLCGKNDSPLKGAEKLFSVEGSEGKIKVFVFNKSEETANEKEIKDEKEYVITESEYFEMPDEIILYNKGEHIIVKKNTEPYNKITYITNERFIKTDRSMAEEAISDEFIEDIKSNKFAIEFIYAEEIQTVYTCEGWRFEKNYTKILFPLPDERAIFGLNKDEYQDGYQQEYQDGPLRVSIQPESDYLIAIIEEEFGK